MVVGLEEPLRMFRVEKWSAVGTVLDLLALQTEVHQGVEKVPG